MKFVSASIFLSLMSCVSALEKPSSILESMHSERHLKKLLELDEGFAMLQQDTTERDLQIGSGLFCQKQLDECQTYTEGSSIESWTTYLAPAQNGTLPFGLDTIFNVIELFAKVGITIGETLGFVTLTNVLTVVENALTVLSDLLSRLREETFDNVVAKMIELEEETSKVMEPGSPSWELFSQLQALILDIVQDAVANASARGSAAVATSYDVMENLAKFYVDLYRSITAAALGPTSASVVDCQTALVSCSVDHLAMDTVPALTSLVVYMGSEANATGTNETLPVPPILAKLDRPDPPIVGNATAPNATAPIAPVASNAIAPVLGDATATNATAPVPPVAPVEPVTP